MKKILVYSFHFYPFENANTNVLMPLLEELKKSYDITVYTSKFDPNLVSEELYKGIKIVRHKILAGRVSRGLLGIYDISKPKMQDSPISFKKIVWTALHCFSRETLCRFLIEFPPQRAYQKEIATGRYDILLTVSAPIITQYETVALAKKGYFQKKSIQWFAYFCDPYATYIGNQAKRDSLIKKEIEIYHLAQAVFTTAELKEDNQHCELKQYDNKTIAIPYANVRRLKAASETLCFSKEKIHCVYVGSLFDIRVRNPEYLYRLAAQCGDKFCFHIVCYTCDEENDALRRRYVEGSDNIVWYEKRPIEECLHMICQANILINLGNLCTNQTPSKIFDYISSGKPIVNIHALEADTAQRYLECYPLALSISENNRTLAENAKKFQEFCVANQSKTIPFEQIARLYRESMPEQAVQALIKQFESF